MCGEVVVVVVVVIVILVVVMMVVASAQNKKKKVRKKPHVESGHVLARRVCELSCRRHHHRYIYNKSVLFFIPVSYRFLFIHVWAQLLTLVVYATFDLLYIYIYI
jgi:NADH:ubiquinone oxidoreductase subunit 3 (subunit A)